MKFKKKDLVLLAEQFETKEFIADDPVQFLHNYTRKKDIEVAGIIAMMFAYGSRKVFIPVIEKLLSSMKTGPYMYIMSQEYDVYAANNSPLYRMHTYNDFYELCVTLYRIYNSYYDLEDCIIKSGKYDYAVDNLKDKFGHLNLCPDMKSKSACKRYHMFLRWMGRKNSPVDLGIWESLRQGDLMVPVDTHVAQMARSLCITYRLTEDMVMSNEIYLYAKEVFPDDPARLDFSLYGYAVSLKK